MNGSVNPLVRQCAVRWCAGLLVAVACAGCGGSKPAGAPTAKTDAYYHRMITSGYAAFERGDIGRAAELYANAWQRAQLMDHAGAMGTSAYNLALCRMALGDLTEALELLREARAELERSGVSGHDVRLVEAECMYRLGRGPESVAIIDELLPLDLERRQRVQLYTLRALIALDRDNREEAEASSDAAMDRVNRHTPERLRARLAEVEGRLALMNGAEKEAAWAFDRESTWYQEANRFTDMARALVRAGQAYQDAGEAVAAVDRYYRAARHYAADGKPVEALRLVEETLPFLETGAGAPMRERVVRLVEELRDAVKKDAD